MSLQTVYELAIVLTKSQLRGTQQARWIARLFGTPRIILVADVLGLFLPGLAGYFVLYRYVGSYLGPALRLTVPGLLNSVLAGLPTGVVFMVIIFGIFYEISQPTEFLSTNLVNWLPISPAEYVGASVISEAYIYSFIVSLFLGALLGPALYFGSFATWATALAMTILAMFIGACVVELLDSLTNRISSSFYKKSGRTGIVFRLVLTIALFVLIQLMFSGQLIVVVLRSIVQTVETAWFVPVVWPSLVVLNVSRPGNLVAVFSALSTIFALSLFGLATVLRARFWVPVPVSIKLTAQPYKATLHGSLFPGLGQLESAIVKKDWRSLVRRREMARFLAIPFVLAVSLFVSSFGAMREMEPGSFPFVALITVYIIPITIFAEMLSMVSIGQEGKAIWNLYAAPLGARNLLKAKVAFTLMLAIPFCAGLIVVVEFLTRALVQSFPLLLLLGIAIAFEQATIGAFFGARYPDFRETVRNRYVGVWGSLGGMLTGIVVALVTTFPLIFSSVFYGVIVNTVAAFGFVIAAVVFLLTWRLAENQLSSLLANIRV